MDHDSLACLMSLAASDAETVWTTTADVDEMTGETRVFAVSPFVPATRPMAFPYQGTRAWLGYGCDANSEWVYIGFDPSPNPTGYGVRAGYIDIRTRMRWDDEVESVQLRLPLGASCIYFDEHARALARLEASSTAVLELDWFGNGQTCFRFSLDGSTAAIERARSQAGFDPSRVEAFGVVVNGQDDAPAGTRFASPPRLR